MSGIIKMTITAEDGQACEHEYCVGDDPCYVCGRLNAHGKYTRTVETKKDRKDYDSNVKYYITWKLKQRCMHPGREGWNPVLNYMDKIAYWSIRINATKEYERLIIQFPRCQFKLIKEKNTTLLNTCPV